MLCAPRFLYSNRYPSVEQSTAHHPGSTPFQLLNHNQTSLGWWETAELASCVANLLEQLASPRTVIRRLSARLQVDLMSFCQSTVMGWYFINGKPRFNLLHFMPKPIQVRTIIVNSTLMWLSHKIGTATCNWNGFLLRRRAMCVLYHSSHIF